MLKSFIGKYYRVFFKGFLIVGAHKRNKNSGFVLACEIDAAIKKKENLVFVLSSSKSPPLFGDFLTLLMLIRFINCIGGSAQLIYCEVEKTGEIWNHFSSEIQSEIIFELENLSRFVIKNPSKVIFTREKFESVVKILKSQSRDRVIDSSNLEIYSPFALHTLIKSMNKELPSDFLLEMRKCADIDEEYIAVHVRNSPWDLSRNYSLRKSVKDLTFLQKKFPNFKIMLLSDEYGLKSLKFALKGSRLLENIVFQPNLGYVNALRYVLGSRYYFQRKGGGIGVVAIFSKLPYLIINAGKTSFYGAKKQRIVPWAQRDQQFIHTSERKSKRSIRYFSRL